MITSNFQIGRAGQYLQRYETKRYKVTERFGFSLKSIMVPQAAEELADVSFWQREMDWDEYSKHARAVILRVGQGQWVDTEFEKNYTEAKKRGLLVGGYWFFDGRVQPLEQFSVIKSSLQGKQLDLEMFIDWERTYSGKYEGLKNVVSLMKLVESGGFDIHGVGLYTGYYWFTEHDDKTQHEYLKSKALWLAWYASPSIVKVPVPWTNWTLWQKGTPTVDWGQPTAEIDMNVYNGSKEAFTQNYGTSVPSAATHLVEVYVDKIKVFEKTI